MREGRTNVIAVQRLLEFLSAILHVDNKTHRYHLTETLFGIRFLTLGSFADVLLLACPLRSKAGQGFVGLGALSGSARFMHGLRPETMNRGGTKVRMCFRISSASHVGA